MVQPIQRTNCHSIQPIITAIKKPFICLARLFKKMVEPLAGYFLKVCVFRDAALKGRCSQKIMTPIARGVINTWMRCQKIPNVLLPFDKKRLKVSADFLAEFGEVQKTKAEDGTEIEWALYTPQKFNEWVTAQGGVRDGEWIRPRTPEDWPRLERLEQFRWFEKIGQAFRVPAARPGAERKCLLRLQGFGRDIPMDKGYIGLHLAAGFNFAIFNWREKIYAKGFFQDVEAVYQEVKKTFPPNQIVAMGSCRATFPLTALKQRHHQEGLDVVLMHTPTSLRETIGHNSWPANKIGLLGLGAIEKDGVNFDNLEKLRSLTPATSRTCLIFSEGDKTVSENAQNDLTAAAQAIGPCDIIIEPKYANGADPHFGEPLKNSMVLERYLQFLNG